MSAKLIVVVLATVFLSIDAAYECPAPGFKRFDCPNLPPPPPATNVTSLRPGNIDAVLALGDSITAGFAMEDLPLEYRGLTYSTGGDEGAFTIGNYLSHYNKDIEGRCTGTTIPLTHEGKGLNTAVSGAVVRDLPGQIKRMVEILDDHKYAKAKAGWKLLTIFIGANDICACHRTTPEDFESHLREALDMVRSNITNVFVNTMTIFNISQVWDDSKNSLYCETAVPILHECGCLTKNATDRQRMDELGLKINAVTRKVSLEYAALNDPHFTVVNQPGVDETNTESFPKETRERFLSDVDCFHPSLCGDQAFSVAVWNNMFTKAGAKKHTLDPADPPPIYCPTESDFIQ